MGDTENEILENASAEAKSASNDVTIEELTAQAAKSAATKKSINKKGNAGVWASFKGEFKKIIWPSGQTLTKETIAVIVGSVILGAIIALVDYVIRFGLGFII